MFEVDLGKIKFKWKGVWNNATAYTVDDVVRFGDSAYVAIDASTNQAPIANPSKWELMVSGVTGVLTTKGDLLFHNGSGAARLPIGATNQILTVGADGNPAWTHGGELVQTQTARGSTAWSKGDSTIHVLPDTTLTMTTRTANPKFRVSGWYQVDDTNSSTFGAGIGFQYSLNNGSTWTEGFYPNLHSDYAAINADKYYTIQREWLQTPITLAAGSNIQFRLTSRFNNGNAQGFAGNGGGTQWMQQIIVQELRNI